MPFPRLTAGAACAALAIPLLAGDAGAHGFAGARFFPATILTDDPFVADELSLPTVAGSPRDADGAHEFGLDWDLAKRITPDLGISFGQGWKYLKPSGSPAVTGLDAFHAGLDYQLFRDGPREAIGLVGLHASFGHTGRIAVGAPDFTTLSPTVAFGKGFGDLPQSLSWLRPIAITGNMSVDFPTKTTSADTINPNNFNYGFAFEYSLEYLQRQRLHWMGLETCYRRSAYFEYYEDDLAVFYQKQQQIPYLFDYNEQLLQLLLKLTKIKAEIKYTDEYHPEYSTIPDFRTSIHPKKETELEQKSYFQVFEERKGFLKNLSIVDLLFNQGPQSINYLL